MINLLYCKLNFISVSQAVPVDSFALFIIFNDWHSGILASPNPIKISLNTTQISHSGKNTKPYGLAFGDLFWKSRI